MLVVFEAEGWFVYVSDGVVGQVGVEAPQEVEGPRGLKLGAPVSAVEGGLVFDRYNQVFAPAGTTGITISVGFDDDALDLLAEAAEENDEVAISSNSTIRWLGVHDGDDDADYVPVTLLPS